MVIQKSDTANNLGTSCPITLIHERKGKIKKLHPKEPLDDISSRVMYASKFVYLSVVQRLGGHLEHTDWCLKNSTRANRTERRRSRSNVLGATVASRYTLVVTVIHTFSTFSIRAASDPQGTILEFSGLTFVPHDNKILPVLRRKQGTVATFPNVTQYFFTPVVYRDDITLSVS
uniref:COesterase domain-containing protein n=1 Tax=Steinernema glaseri TaxID=37863 RepID=A0A1I8AEI1_9BILA